MEVYAIEFPDARGSNVKIDVTFDRKDGTIDSTTIMHRPKLAICGPGVCGKDTAAIWFAEHTILEYYYSTSYIALSFVFEKMVARGHPYPTPQDCYANRHLHRRTWAMLIDEYNSKDHARLYREHIEFSGSDILTGIRKRRELDACKAAGLITLKLWIEKLCCPPDETLDYGPEACDIIIPNNSDIPALHEKLYNFAKFNGILKCKPANTA